MGTSAIGKVSPRFVVKLCVHRVCGVLLYLKGVKALQGRGEPNRLHVIKLVGEDQADGGLVVYVVGEVHEDRA